VADLHEEVWPSAACAKQAFKNRACNWYSGTKPRQTDAPHPVSSYSSVSIVWPTPVWNGKRICLVLEWQEDLSSCAVLLHVRLREGLGAEGYGPRVQGLGFRVRGFGFSVLG
jgi:hypothetical protein